MSRNIEIHGTLSLIVDLNRSTVVVGAPARSTSAREVNNIVLETYVITYSSVAKGNWN